MDDTHPNLRIALAVVGALKAIKSARSAANLSKLRDLNTGLKSYAGEYAERVNRMSNALVLVRVSSASLAPPGCGTFVFVFEN